MEAQPKKRPNAAAYQLIAAILVTVITLFAILIPRKAKEGAGGTVVPETETVSLADSGRGALAEISAANPQTKEDAAAVGSECVPLDWHTSGAYEVSCTGLRLHSLAQLQLERLLTVYSSTNATYSVPTVSGAYLGWEEQGENAGSDPRGGGMIVILSLRVPSGDTLTEVPLTSPLAQSFSAWLASHAAAYGFTLTDAGTLRFVGIPHAAYLFSQSVTLSGYLALVKTKTQKTPLVIETGGETYEIFYLAASGKETTELTLPAESDYTVSGTNSGGFVVTVRRP